MLHRTTFPRIGVGAGLTILLALLAAACRSSTAPAPAPVSADTLAVVEGRNITRADVEQAMRRVGDGAPPPSSDEGRLAELSLLEEMIVEQILLAKAAELKIEVPETEVEKAYGEMRKNIPEETFQQELTRRNLTTVEMREGIRRELLAQEVIKREALAKVTVSDEDVNAFFTANRAQFNFPEDAYHLAQIVITPVREPQPPNRTGHDATTAEEAAQKVTMLMGRLKEGVAFGELARDYSEDPESTPRGGDLGLVPLSALKQAPPALRDAALQTPPGNARVVSQNGAHTIVYVVAREAAGQRELTTPGVREDITQTIRGQREQLLRTAYLNAVRAQAEVRNYLAERILENQGKP